MTSLVALWETSLALCAIVSLALAALLLARVIARGHGERRTAARSRIFPLLLGNGDCPGPLQGLDLRVAADLTCELSELTRGSDLEAMLERAAKMGVPGMLVCWLNAGSPQKRLTAVETLGLFAEEGGQVASALDDRNRDVRLGAALILARREDGPSVDTLVRKLRIGTQEHSLMIVTLMTDLAERDPDGVAALLLAKDVSYEAKVAATDALSVSGGRYAPLLAQMAQGSCGESDLQQRIYKALGKTGHPSGAAAIITGLGNPDAAVRAAAAEAAGKARLAQAADALGALLSDTDFPVRYQAANSLLRLGPSGMATLWAATEGEDGPAREAAGKMLAEARVA